MLELINLFLQRYSFFQKLLLEHIYLSFIAIIFITSLGLFLGILMTYNRFFAKTILNVVNILYTIPSIALFGILVAYSGIGNKSAIIALIIYGLLPMIKNTYVGLQEVDQNIIEAAVGMGATNKQLLFHVKLPLAAPLIFAGFRTAVVMTIALCGIASFIGAGGLGVAIWRGITTNFMELTLLGSILVALLAVISDLILSIVEHQVKKRIGII